jgi:hypothetical protein
MHLTPFLKMTAFKDVALSSLNEVIALMMEAICISETWIYFDETTWRCIPEGCHLHTRHCENLKYLTQSLFFSLCFIFLHLQDVLYNHITLYLYLKYGSQRLHFGRVDSGILTDSKQNLGVTCKVVA